MIIWHNLRMEGVTILVATQAMEEGIDVQTCNCIIRYDVSQTTKSHIQGNGRHEPTGVEASNNCHASDAERCAPPRKQRGAAQHNGRRYESIPRVTSHDERDRTMLATQTSWSRSVKAAPRVTRSGSRVPLRECRLTRFSKKCHRCRGWENDHNGSCRRNKRVTSLDLTRDQIESAGAKSLANALKKRPNFKSLAKRLQFVFGVIVFGVSVCGVNVFGRLSAVEPLKSGVSLSWQRTR